MRRFVSASVGALLLACLVATGCSGKPAPGPTASPQPVKPTPTDATAQFHAQVGFMLSCPNGTPTLTTFLFDGAPGTIPPAPKDLLDKLVKTWGLQYYSANGKCQVVFQMQPGTQSVTMERSHSTDGQWRIITPLYVTTKDDTGSYTSIAGPEEAPGEEFLALCQATGGSPKDSRLPVGVSLQWSGSEWVPPAGVPSP